MQNILFSVTIQQKGQGMSFLVKLCLRLYNRTNELHFLSFNFVFDNILYLFRIGKLFIIRRQCYMQRLVCIMHSYRLAAVTVKMELLYGYVVVGLLNIIYN